MDEREQVIGSLRAVADFLEQNPSAPVPHIGEITAFVNTVEDVKGELRRIVKEVPGPWKKAVMESFYSIVKDFGAFTYEVTALRHQVCRKIETGEVKVIPAQEEKVVPKYRWECDDSLLAPDPEPVS